MNRLIPDGFKMQITNSGSNLIVSGDLFWNEKEGFIAILHNNGKKFTDKDSSERVVLLALNDFLEQEI